MIITGLRGVGKTVVLNLFAERARESRWQVAEFEASRNDDAHFRGTLFSVLRAALLQISPRQRWTDRAHRAASALSSFSVSAAGLSVSWDVAVEDGLADHGNLSMDLTDVLVTLGEVAGEAGRGIVILVDEVQFLRKTQLEAVIQGIHKTVQRKLPITFVGAGLPQIAELAGDKSYAERLFTFPVIGSLDESAAHRALAGAAEQEGVTFEHAALELAVQITQAIRTSCRSWDTRLGRSPKANPSRARMWRSRAKRTTPNLTPPSSASDSTVPPRCRPPTCGQWRSWVPSHTKPVTSHAAWVASRLSWGRRGPSSSTWASSIRPVTAMQLSQCRTSMGS